MKPAKRTSVRSGALADSDFAGDEMGRNSLQGDDQANVRNQRHDRPDMKSGSEDVLDSFEKMDKDVRAEKDLNKGRRHSQGRKRAGDTERSAR